MINYRLKIDFSDSKTLASDICFVSGDIKSSTLYFEFYNEGKRVDISGYTLSVRAKRSDGVVVASSGKIKENTAVFTPESNMYCVPGELYMEIALSDSSGRYATTKVIIAEVIEGLGEAAIDGVDNLNVYVTLLSQAVTAASCAEESKNLANEYSILAREAAQRAENVADEALISAGGSIFSNAIKENASGEVIRFDDVSPIEHTVRVKVSGDDISDMSKIKVTAYGENILGFNQSFTISQSGITVDYDNETQIFTLNGTGTGTIRLTKYLDKTLKEIGAGTTATITIECIDGNISYEDRYNVFYISGINGTTASHHAIGLPTLKKSKTIVSDFCHLDNGVGFVIANHVTFTDYKIRIQLEFGENSTSTNYIPNSDGMLEIPSVSPTMTLLTDTKGVNIEAECNKDLNKALEKLQNAIISLGGNV